MQLVNFSALPEQLGLRLEAKKAPVEVLVIDHAGATDAELNPNEGICHVNRSIKCEEIVRNL